MTGPLITEIADELAATVDAQWRKIDYDPSAFDKVTSEAFAKINPSAQLSSAQMLSDAILGGENETYLDHHPAVGIVTLKSTPYYNIEGHFWTDEHAHAHSHSWSGAYHIIEGTSIVGMWKMNSDAAPEAPLRLGSLESVGVEALKEGHVQAVVPGHSFIHSIWYAGFGAAMSIRSKWKRVYADANYLRPYVGYNFADPGSPMITRAIESMRALSIIDPDKFETTAAELVRTQPFNSVAFFALHAGKQGWHMPPELSAVGTQRFGEKFVQVEASMRDHERIGIMEKIRAELVTDRSKFDIGFFLGALYTCETRVAFMDLIACEYGDQEAEPFAGHHLATLLAEPDDGEEMPASLVFCFGRFAAGATPTYAIKQTAQRFAGTQHLEHQLAFLDLAFAQIKDAPVYDVLFA